jgi:SAM-dependent methyltransferase
MDSAQGMLDLARKKLHRLPQPVRSRIVLRHLDVAGEAWPQGFDLVILGNNCLYELATAEEQEACLQSAAQALRPGGCLYLDNDHMEGDLDPSWQEPGPALAFPTGLCADGTYLESTLETIWFEAGRRLVRLRRHTKAVFTDGRTVEMEYIQQKHPVSVVEIRAWLTASGFALKGLFGDHAGNPYQPESVRAIAWAQKME